jgi:hypothetical protein
MLKKKQKNAKWICNAKELQIVPKNRNRNSMWRATFNLHIALNT